IDRNNTIGDWEIDQFAIFANVFKVEIGTIPPEIGNLVNLVFFDLGHNQIFGTIPKELGNLVGLGCLILEENELTGTIPPEIGNLSNLTSISLEMNELCKKKKKKKCFGLESVNDNYLFSFFKKKKKKRISGTIPPEIGNLTNLQFLYMRLMKLRNIYMVYLYPRMILLLFENIGD
ncbi:hypothetical protein RFI_39246, partial [Reticulomyxa filosa]